MDVFVEVQGFDGAVVADEGGVMGQEGDDSLWDLGTNVGLGCLLFLHIFFNLHIFLNSNS